MQHLRRSAAVLGILVAALAAAPGTGSALTIDSSAAVTCTDGGPVQMDGGPGIPSAQCSYQVNTGGLFPKSGTVDAAANATVGFRTVAVSSTVDAELITRLPTTFGASTSASATVMDTFIMDARFPNGTPVPGGLLGINVATNGFVNLFFTGQALNSSATLSYALSVGGVGIGDTITVFAGDSPVSFSAILPVVIPWAQGVPLSISMSASATIEGILIDDGTLDISVDFGNSLTWLGITEVTDSEGTPVASYTAVSDDGIDWAVQVPEPSTALLLATGGGLVALLLRGGQGGRRQRLR